MTSHKSISNLCKKILIPLRDIFYDSPIYKKENTTTIQRILKSILKTLQYRLCSIRIPLTANERKILMFENRHRSERCFIVGNGPSLNDLDLTKLKHEITFGVNAIYTNFDKMGFYPTYYVVEDTFVAEDRASEINTYKDSLKFYGNYLSYCLIRDDKSILLNVIMNYSDYEDFPHFSRDVARRVWVGGTVTYICLQLAYYMGFKEVYLIGFDHSYSIPPDALVAGLEITSTSDDPNHFNRDYFGKGKRWHDPKVDRMEKAYKRAKEYFETDGRLIYNATAGGKLEVFQRVDFRSLF
jgi:hypothetical protein